jgi:hypothetical protein
VLFFGISNVRTLGTPHQGQNFAFFEPSRATLAVFFADTRAVSRRLPFFGPLSSSPWQAAPSAARCATFRNVEGKPSFTPSDTAFDEDPSYFIAERHRMLAQC